MPYSADGRLIGSYIYILLCQDEGPIYVKVGSSDDPVKRLAQLRHNCPVAPKNFFYMGLHNRKLAFKVEFALHKALDAWRTHLEWYALTVAEKPEFNKILREVLHIHRRASQDLKWNHISVPQLAKVNQERQRVARHRFANAGDSYQDFVKHGGLTAK